MEEFSKLKIEDQDFYNYLRLIALRSANTITPEDSKKIEEIVSRENRSKELETLYKNVIDKKATINDYTSKFEQYKKGLEESINNTIKGTPSKEEVKEEPKQEEKKELSDESKGIIEYFKLEIKRVNTPLTDEEKNRVEELRTSIQKVRTLEEAHRRVSNKEIPTQVLKRLRENYKGNIREEITTLGLNEKDFLPDDTAIYLELEEIDKKEVPKEVTKSSLTDIKKIFDIKKDVQKEAHNCLP